MVFIVVPNDTGIRVRCWVEREVCLEQLSRQERGIPKFMGVPVAVLPFLPRTAVYEHRHPYSSLTSTVLRMKSIHPHSTSITSTAFRMKSTHPFSSITSTVTKNEVHAILWQLIKLQLKFPMQKFQGWHGGTLLDALNHGELRPLRALDAIVKAGWTLFPRIWRLKLKLMSTGSSSSYPPLMVIKNKWQLREKGNEQHFYNSSLQLPIPLVRNLPNL